MPFFPWKGIDLGLRANVEITRDDLITRVEAATGQRPHFCQGGPKEVRKVGVITGGAGSEIFDIAATGIDTFITGEGPHWSYTAAEELGINVIYAGHYATETFGVKALPLDGAMRIPGCPGSSLITRQIVNRASDYSVQGITSPERAGEHRSSS